MMKQQIAKNTGRQRNESLASRVLKTVKPALSCLHRAVFMKT
jgi:hypothetical protein